MKSSPSVGDHHRFAFVVTDAKTVPSLYPESEDFCAMPPVFATGFMVGLMEWACIDALKPHLEDGEGSLGIAIEVNHVAATLPGQTVTVDVHCIEAEGNRLGWRVSAHDGIDLIGEGTHRRAVVAWERFNQRLAAKRKRL
ncbi:thioesterase [Paramagnetospirillum marisnigri]|uniref:Thioesterase n=1 Tax=Paramagnetospirillum marisnigri TaxID=1285242 RepID=A0A178N0B7_9PROT|nr:thioesterase family protein [Paramagnetospirillum marisnigri]OAN56020.1 thioesterase [Paramagnetospirillum marisnigri]